MLADLIQKSQSVVELASRMDEVEAARQLVRDRRLKHFMESAGPLRAHQELSRAFFRALAELRKHQDWRFKNHTLEG